MSNERTTMVRQYIVYHLKMVEILHLTLLSFHLTETGVCPENFLGHGVDRFRESLLGAVVTAFMAIFDKPKSTNVLAIWKDLHPTHAQALDRIWERRVKAGEDVMKAYRDQAGAHGDRPEKYFAGKMALMRNQAQVLMAMHTFYGLSACLLRRQAKELPALASEIETILLDIELSFDPLEKFDRRWLRAMHLTERGNYSKKFF